MKIVNILSALAIVAFLACSALATPQYFDNDNNDNDDDGYSQSTGTNVWAYSSSLSPTFDGDISYAAVSGATATWSFSGLDNGTYTVYAIWLQHSAATTAAKYAISDGGGDIPVDQTNAPGHDLQITDSESDEEWFERLGTATVADGTLSVVLSNANTTGYIFADAVAIEAPEPTTLLMLTFGGLVAMARKRRGRLLGGR